MSSMLTKLRRFILKRFVPEIFWPKTVQIGRATIPVRGQPFSFGVKRLLVKGEYEHHEIKLLEGRIESADQVIEMGGSVGILTACIASNLGPEGRIVSIEADSKLVEQSRAWLSRQNRAITILHGIGFPVYQLNQAMHIKDFSNDGGSLGGRVSFATDDTDPAVQDVEFPVYDIKTVMDQTEIEPSVLVFDIEGSETVMCSNQPSIPRSVRLLLIELHPSIYGHEMMESIKSSIVDEGFKLIDESGASFLYERRPS